MSSVIHSTASAGTNPWQSFSARIESVHVEIPAVATYRLRLEDDSIAKAYRFQPGQFNMLYLPGCGEVAISLSGSPAQDGTELVHTIRVVGRVTEAISKLTVGARLGVRGPFGTAWPIDRCYDRDVLIVTGGLGLAPLRPLIYAMIHERSRFRRIVLLYGARSPDLILYQQELAGWSESEIEVFQTVDRADDTWTGSVGVVSLLLDRLKGVEAGRTTVVTCGPEVMMHYSAISAIRRGIPRESIWLSMERNMQCAVGLCGHCQLGPTFVCRTGPVFRYDVMEPFLKIRDF